MAELRQSGDYFRDEDFDIDDIESMDEIFQDQQKLSILKVYKNEGRASINGF